MYSLEFEYRDEIYEVEFDAEYDPDYGAPAPVILNIYDEHGTVDPWPELETEAMESCLDWLEDV